MNVINIDPNEQSEVEESIASGTPGIRIILADSQAIYRVGMRKVFALEDDIRVVAQAETLQNLYAALARFPTDVVLCCSRKPWTSKSVTSIFTTSLKTSRS